MSRRNHVLISGNMIFNGIIGQLEIVSVSVTVHGMKMLVGQIG